jgi:hypothetical protein
MTTITQGGAFSSKINWNNVKWFKLIDILLKIYKYI